MVAYPNHPDIGDITTSNRDQLIALAHAKNAVSEFLAATGAAGNLTTDAHSAAAAVTHGAALVSSDGDFARFPNLRWKNPLSA